MKTYQLNPLIPENLVPGLEKGVVAQHEKFQKSLKEVQKKSATIRTRYGELRAAFQENLGKGSTRDMRHEAEDLVDNYCACVREELDLRQKFQAWYRGDYEKTIQDRLEECEKALEDAKNNLLKKVEELGFELQVDKESRFYVEFIRWVKTHPTLVTLQDALRQVAREADLLCNPHGEQSHECRNKKAIMQLEQYLRDHPLTVASLT